VGKIGQKLPQNTPQSGERRAGFTHNDPFEDTESCARAGTAASAASFTHNDPFEDTERTA